LYINIQFIHCNRLLLAYKEQKEKDGGLNYLLDKTVYLPARHHHWNDGKNDLD